MTLQLSAINLESLTSKDDNQQSNRLMGECISLLRYRVQDPHLATSDQTIVAVATLAMIEVLILHVICHLNIHTDISHGDAARKRKHENASNAYEWLKKNGQH